MEYGNRILRVFMAILRVVLRKGYEFFSLYEMIVLVDLGVFSGASFKILEELYAEGETVRYREIYFLYAE